MQKRHISNCLKSYARSSKLRLHMPGHKGEGAGINKSVFKYDLTELDVTDNLAEPTGAIKQAEQDIARLLGANRSFILTNGSTLGIFAMLYAVKDRGNKIIIEKSSHKSVFNALKLFNLQPIFLNQKMVDGLAEVDLDNLAELCDNGVIGALLTSPDYFGRVKNLSLLAKVLHDTGKLLLIDGAHGAHLKFTQPLLYNGSYADVWVDGAHKTLKTLTQGAILNSNNVELNQKLREGLNIFASSSPSFLIAASVEDGVKSFAELPEKTYERFTAARELLASSLNSNYKVIPSDDKLKFCLRLKDANGGSALRGYLEQSGVYPELSEGAFVIFILSPLFCEEQAKFLSDLLNSFDGFSGAQDFDYIDNINITPKRQMSYLSASSMPCEYVSLQAALNRVAAANAGLFPPCFPIITCGEVYDNRVIAALLGKNTFGVINGKVKVLKNGNDD